MAAVVFRALLALPTLVASPLACAASSVFLEQLTSPELVAEIAAGRTTIIVPIGGTEQNGPHMTLGKHNARVQVLAGKIAAALGNALVAPVIAYVPEGGIDPPTAHMRFAGTIGIASETFVQTLDAAGRSFRRHGFRDVVFIGDHGGYQKEMSVAAERLNRAWAGTPVRAHAVDVYYRVTETSYPEALKRRGYAPAEIGKHAGLADTSLTLALFPSMVREDRLASDGIKRAEGVQGDPARASAELGQIGVDLIVAETAAAIRAAARR